MSCILLSKYIKINYKNGNNCFHVYNRTRIGRLRKEMMNLSLKVKNKSEK